MSHLQVAAPLPECLLCEAPTRRDVYDATGGFCSECAPTVRMLPIRPDVTPPDLTAFVEGFRPPVPPRKGR